MRTNFMSYSDNYMPPFSEELFVMQGEILCTSPGNEDFVEDNEDW